MWWYLLLSLFSLIGYGSYRLYRSNKVQLLLKVLSMIKPYLKNDVRIPEAEILGEVMILRYAHGGLEHTVRIPYTRMQKMRSTGVRLYVRRGTDMIDVTHQNGVPYTVTARMLGGSGYCLHSEDGIIEIGPDDLP